jgi:hypothetical protein
MVDLRRIRAVLGPNYRLMFRLVEPENIIWLTEHVAGVFNESASAYAGPKCNRGEDAADKRDDGSPIVPSLG